MKPFRGFGGQKVKSQSPVLFTPLTDWGPVSGYRKSAAQNSFLSYFVSTTPDSEHKRVRLKTNLFLQASALLDLDVILSRLKEHPNIFSWEIALIEGKVLAICISLARSTK